MNIVLHNDLNLFSLLILSFVFINGHTRLDWKPIREKLFMFLVLSTAACQASETLAWAFDGVDTTLGYAMNVVSNVLLYVLGPLPAILWSYYAYVVITRSNRIPRRLIWLGFLPFSIHALISIASPVTHTFFLIADGNHYHRGVGYAVGPSLALLCVLVGLVLAWTRRQGLDSKSLHTLLFFPVAPLLGGVIQMAFYGLTTTWSLITFAILLTYINMQDSRLDFDYLTGTFNRRYLDRYLHDRIASALEKPKASRFAVAFADLDDFKGINDLYGHKEGDTALKATGDLFVRNTGKGDMVARYAGDEFVMVLELHANDGMEAIISRLKQAFADYNRGCGKPYDLSVSIGYCVFDSEKGASVEQMIHRADMDMLAAKQRDRAV